MSHSIDCVVCRKTIHDPDAQGQLTLRSEGRTSYLCAACNEVRESPIRWGYIWCAVADELGRLRAEVERLTKERNAACMAAGEYSQDEVNAMTTEMIALRKEYEKIAYRRGAEAMRDACAEMVASEMTSGLLTPGNIRQVVGLIRSLPIPEEP